MITVKESLTNRSDHVVIFEVSHIFVSIGRDKVLCYFRCCCIQFTRNHSKSLFHLCNHQLWSCLRARPIPSFLYDSLIAAASLHRECLDLKIPKRKGNLCHWSEGKVVHETKPCKDTWWKVNLQWSWGHCALA